MVRILKYYGLILSTFFVLTLILSSCAFEDTAQEVSESRPATADESRIAEETASKIADDLKIDITTKRKLILNGHMGILVESAEDTRAKIEGYLKDIDGYMESSSFRTDRDGVISGSVTARIPYELFQECMDFFESLGEVTSMDTYSDDVTTEYVDMDARLRNLLRQEERYLEILDAADTVEDIITVEKALTEVRGDIETMSARLEQLDDLISYSTINLTITEKESLDAQIEAEGIIGLGQRMAAAFTNSINGVIAAGTGLAVFLSGTLLYFIILGGIGFGIYKLGQRLKQRKQG